jgi:hypothetical protein
VLDGTTPSTGEALARLWRAEVLTALGTDGTKRACPVFYKLVRWYYFASTKLALALLNCGGTTVSFVLSQFPVQHPDCQLLAETNEGSYLLVLAIGQPAYESVATPAENTSEHAKPMTQKELLKWIGKAVSPLRLNAHRVPCFRNLDGISRVTAGNRRPRKHASAAGSWLILGCRECHHAFAA